MVGAQEVARVRRRSFVGIDLSAGPGRPSTLATIDDVPSVVYLGVGHEDEELAATVAAGAPQVIAIDAPLFLSQGLCCLEEGCPCHQDFPNPGRRAERALSRLGIGSYYVTKRSFIKPLIYRGIALRQHWEDLGFVVIEVYPYATKVRLFGRRLPRKKHPAGRQFFAERLGELFPNLKDIRPCPSHDEADALLAAYTAFLFTQGETEALGHAAEGFLHIPRARPY